MSSAQRPIKKLTVINIINCVVKLHIVMSMLSACLNECAVAALLPACSSYHGFMYRHLQKGASRNVGVSEPPPISNQN